MLVSDYYWIGLILFGLIFLIVGISLNRKSSLFLSNYEQVEARVIEIYRTHGSHSGRRRMRPSVYITYAEYTVDGKNISGKHFEPVRHPFINFHEGDIITVKVNRRRPALFCIEKVDAHKEFVTSIKMIVFGVVVVAAASFFLFIRMRNGA